MTWNVGALLDQVTDRLICPHCGRVGALTGDREAGCKCGYKWYLGPDVNQHHLTMEKARSQFDNDAEVAKFHREMFEQRIQALEAMVKRIAAHLGIEG